MKHLPAGQGGTFIRRQGLMNQTLAQNFLNSSIDSSNNRSQHSSVNRDHSLGQQSRDRTFDES